MKTWPGIFFVTLLFTAVLPSFAHSPVAMDDEFTALRDITLTINASEGVLENDYVPNYPSALLMTGNTIQFGNFITDPPDHGTLDTIGIWGGFVYTPNEGYTGPDSFSYTCFIEGDITHVSNTATVSLYVYDWAR